MGRLACVIINTTILRYHRFRILCRETFCTIVTSVVAIITGILLSFVWPPIQGGLNGLSNFLLDKNLTLTTFILVLLNVLLFHLDYTIFSMHHFGLNLDNIKIVGDLIRGDQRIWMAQLKDGVSFTAGAFTTGKYPFMMFGLPAAALAIYRNARPERKSCWWFNVISSINIVLNWYYRTFRIFILFVAPLLYVIHALLAGTSFLVMHLLNVKIGMTFSGGFIDYILYGLLNWITNALLVIPVGIVYAFVYYFLFSLQLKFNLKHLVEDEEQEIRQTSVAKLPFDVRCNGR